MPTRSNADPTSYSGWWSRHCLELLEEEEEIRDQLPWLDPKRGGDTFIYFLQPYGGGDIKIGVSTNPLERRDQLQTGSSATLILGRCEWVHHTFERRMHHLFSEYHRRGEWFRAHPVLAHIALFAHVDPDLTDEPLRYPNGSGLPVPDLLPDRFPSVIQCKRAPDSTSSPQVRNPRPVHAPAP